MSMAGQIVVPAVTLALGFGLGLVTGRRTRDMDALRSAYEDLEILRGVPGRVTWRPQEKRSENAKIESKDTEWLPGDRDWKDSCARLLALSSALDDDELYTAIHLAEAHLDGYVRAARSAGMDDTTRDNNRTMHRDRVAHSITGAEARLAEWRSFRGWTKLSLGIGRQRITNRPYVSG